MTDYKYPANAAEAKANRDKFLEALRTEPASNQCQYALYEDADVEGDTEAERKHQKCAVGLAGQVFFGINNVSDLCDWQDEQRDAGEDADVYAAIEKMLGLGELMKYDGSVDSIVDANDGKGLSFADIAGRLSEYWETVA